MTASPAKDIESLYFCLPSQENQIPVHNQISWGAGGGCPGLGSEGRFELPSDPSSISANPSSASMPIPRPLASLNLEALEGYLEQVNLRNQDPTE